MRSLGGFPTGFGELAGDVLGRTACLGGFLLGLAKLLAQPHDPLLCARRQGCKPALFALGGVNASAERGGLELAGSFVGVRAGSLVLARAGWFVGAGAVIRRPALGTAARLWHEVQRTAQQGVEARGVVLSRQSPFPERPSRVSIGDGALERRRDPPGGLLRSLVAGP